jgi:hypothetical protein
MSNWYTATCKECGSDINCHVDWARAPDLCKGCVEKKRAARAKWQEKSCSCGSVIKYHEDWDRIPDLCRDCIAQKKAARAKWIEKSCPCGNVVSHHEDWSNPPSHCKECNAWQTRTCAAQDCSETIRYKSYWERVPAYCSKCKSGEKRIVVRQQKDDGTVHEYEGRGYVTKQGTAVFHDDESTGKHSHAVYRPDGSLKGRREEGWSEQFVNRPINVAFAAQKGVDRDGTVVLAKQNRYTTSYAGRAGKHQHDFSKMALRIADREKGLRTARHEEQSIGEHVDRNDLRQKGK